MKKPDHEFLDAVRLHVDELQRATASLQRASAAPDQVDAALVAARRAFAVVNGFIRQPVPIVQGPKSH